MNEQGKVRKGWTSNFFQVPNGIYDLPISSCAKAVYIYLCRCADRDGQSFPSYMTIGGAIGWGRTKVAEALSELEAYGLLIRQEQYKENGSRDSNLYTIVHPDDVVLLADELPPSATRTTPVHEVNYPRPPHGRAPSARRTVTIHKEQYPYNNTHVTTHTEMQKEIAASQENVEEQPIGEQTERVCEELKSVLEQKGINVQTKTVRLWLKLAPPDDVIYAVELATKDDVRNPAAFISGVLKKGIVRVEERKPERDPRYEAFYRLMDSPENL
jgi:hypothetical protein